MKKSMKAVVATVFALTSTFAMTSTAGASAPSVKNNDKCTKLQYGKTTKTGTTSFKCTFSSKTKKYTWTKVAALATTAPAIDLAKLDKTGWPTKFIVGGVPAENVTTMQTKWDGLIQLFKDELGMPVEFYAGTSYAGVIEASIAKKVDMVAWGAMSYIVSKLNGAKIEPLGITKYVDGTTSYTSKLVVPTGSTITSIAGLKGKTVCFVSSTSTSGNLIPTEGILSAGLKMSDLTQSFKGSHDNSILGLGAGQCDAAFAQEATVAAIGTGTFAAMKASDYKTIWESGPIPNGPFTISSLLPASFRAAVKNILLTKLNKEYFTSKGYNGCTSVATCIIVEDKNTTSFISVTDAFYDTIRKVCEATKSTACKA
ncbi:MAG: phosphate/phosphite/phosphonate ABC transporter substrate-binding protein [Ilumatobacteraceae bacterium]